MNPIEANDKRAGFQIDWKNTKVGATEGHTANSPWPKLLQNSRPAIHTSDFDDLRSLLARHKPKPAKQRSVAFDSSPYLNPNENVRDAMKHLETTVANRQRDNSAWNFWCVLQSCAKKMPTTARVKDMDKGVVNFCLPKLIENLL